MILVQSTTDIDLVKQASAIPLERRSEFLTQLLETDLQHHLASLFNRIEGAPCAEVTHGPSEYGRDVVYRRADHFGEEYVGIVVKRDPSGRMSGRTAGAIDEAISQAKQAIVHPCPLKEIHVGPVEIATVWIAMFCRMSNNAMIRLENETKGILGRRIFTLDQLTDLFTKHYPEVFFEGGASEYITEKITELESWKGITEHKQMLSGWFVHPRLMVTNAQSGSNDEVSFEMPHTTIPFGRVNELIKPSAKLVLTGDPGSGKSAALRKIALDRLTEVQRATISGDRPGLRRRGSTKIAVPIVLNAVSVNSTTSIADLLESQLPPEGGVRDKFDVDLLLVDGLDEIPKDARPALLEDIFRQADLHNCCLIISSRKVPSLQIDIIGHVQGTVQVLDIQPFQLPQAVEMVDRITNDADVTSIVRDGLLRINYQIMFTPIALELLIEVARAEREIPGSKSEIFDRYTDIALGRYDVQKGIQVVFEFYVKKRFLAALAWNEFKCKGRTEVPRPDFEAFVRNYSTEYGWEPESFDTLVGEIERSGILRIGDTVLFAHRALVEFFIAWWLVNNQQKMDRFLETVAELYFDWLWSEAALYAVGQLREVSDELLLAVMNRESSGINDDLLKFMFGRLLQAGWHSTADVKIAGIERGMSFARPVLAQIEEIRAREAGHMPSIIPLFFLLSSAEYAYGSRTLVKELPAVIGNLPTNPEPADFFIRLALLWAIRDKLDPAELGNLVQGAVDHLAALEKESSLTIDRRINSLIFLAEIGRDDDTLVRSLKRKANRMVRNNPTLRNVMSTATRGVRNNSPGR